MIAFAKPDNIIAMPTKSNEWYTPARYVEAAREVMGSIDLDVASCAEANIAIKATRYYTRNDNGLDQQWAGNIWLNPPYGANNHLPNEKKSFIRQWIDKLLSSYKNGDVEQAIACLLVQPSARWFGPLWEYPICFADHNVRFFLPNKSTSKHRQGRNTDAHLFGTIFVYLGPNEQRFIDIFSQFGTIAKRVSTPKERPVTLSLWGDA